MKGEFYKSPRFDYNISLLKKFFGCLATLKSSAEISAEFSEEISAGVSAEISAEESSVARQGVSAENFLLQK